MGGARSTARRGSPNSSHRAFATATAGRPGPVVLALPEDMLVEAAQGDGRAAPAGRARARAERDGRAARLLATAERPFVILGGGGWNAQGCADCALPRSQRAAGGLRLPPPGPARQRRTATTPAISASAPTRSWPRAIKDADLVLAIGARLGETTTRATPCSMCPRPAQRLVHVHTDPEELGSVYQADLPILSAPQRVRRRPRRRAPAGSAPALGRGHGRPRMPTSSPGAAPTRIAGPAAAWQVVAWLRERLPARRDPHQRRRQLRDLGATAFRAIAASGTQLAPTSGSMGYGLPAAVAAKIVIPSGRSSASPATAAS